MSSPFITFKTSSSNINQLVTPKLVSDTGFRSGQLYVLFGKPKVGKSTVTEDLALNAIADGASVAYIDGDMQGIDYIRFNEILTAREKENFPISPLPNKILDKSPKEVESIFKQHLKEHKFFLQTAKTTDQFKKSYLVLANKPDLVICDSLTLFFRQDQILGVGRFGSAVRTVDQVATALRLYSKGSQKQFKTPNDSACVVCTAQSKSEVSGFARQANLRSRREQGEKIPTRELQIHRPFVGGEGFAYLSESFIEILHDSTDPSGRRRIAEVWGSRNLVDGSQANFQIIDRGIADFK